MPKALYREYSPGMSILIGGMTADHSASDVFTASKPPLPSGTETMNSCGSTTCVIASTIT